MKNYTIIIALIVLVYFSFMRNEHFGSSQGGALIQLMAKGAQDRYLTGEPSYYNTSYRRNLR